LEETPEELDWVNKRADCELEIAFQQLGDAVQTDVELYNSRFNLQNAYALVFQRDGTYPLFSVYRRTHAGHVSVAFHQKTNHIEIEDQCGAQSLSAAPLLTTNGRCKFRVRVKVKEKEQELMEQWQLRRAALEAIFFRPMPK
jgi:hypothetical protein